MEISRQKTPSKINTSKWDDLLITVLMKSKPSPSNGVPWIPTYVTLPQESTTIYFHTIIQLNVSKYLGKFTFEASNNSSNDFLFGQVASFEIAVVAGRKYSLTSTVTSCNRSPDCVEEGDYVRTYQSDHHQMED